MISYSLLYNQLKDLFNPESQETTIPGSQIRIINTDFSSDDSTCIFLNPQDSKISENTSFSYPVFTPADRKSRKVILFLHGLNERSWVKYLPWAFRLASDTGSYVIMFPISFHINRSPESWRDPRAMNVCMKDRNLQYGKVDMSSFANVALSNRLTEDPMRFFSSGYQTSGDILKLILSINRGEHPLIPSTSKINIFAYSIGAFLAQIMIMANPQDIFSESKLFMFCGGSVFSSMKGSSKLIMDKLAFEKVYRYYLHDFERSLDPGNPLREILHITSLGKVFRSMIDFSKLKPFRENILKNLKGRIHSVSLEDDKVIPAEGIKATLCNWNKNLRNVVDIKDFPFPYTHENPFPVFNSVLRTKVDESFNTIFSGAARFLS